MSNRPYTVEVEKEACGHCGVGRMWTVVGPDGIALGQSWGEEEGAEELADAMNCAYAAGQSASARVERSPLGIAAAMANCALGATLDGYPFKDEEIKDIRRRLTEALTGTVSEVGLQEAARAVLHDAKWLADAYEQNGVGTITAAMAARFKALGDALAKNPNPTVAAVIDAPGPRHGWIPVGDRLPEGDDVVWIRVAATPIDNPMPWMGSGHYCRDDPFRDDPYWEAAGPLGWASPIDVTHWQPLDAKTEVPRPSEGRDFVKEARARFRLDSNVSYPSRVAANDVRRFIHEIADAYERLRILYMATCAVVHRQKADTPSEERRPSAWKVRATFKGTKNTLMSVMGSEAGAQEYAAGLRSKAPEPDIHFHGYEDVRVTPLYEDVEPSEVPMQRGPMHSFCGDPECVICGGYSPVHDTDSPERKP